MLVRAPHYMEVELGFYHEGARWLQKEVSFSPCSHNADGQVWVHVTAIGEYNPRPAALLSDVTIAWWSLLIASSQSALAKYWRHPANYCADVSSEHS